MVQDRKSGNKLTDLLPIKNKINLPALISLKVWIFLKVQMSIQVKPEIENFCLIRICNHMMLELYFLILLRNYYRFLFKPDYILPNLCIEFIRFFSPPSKQFFMLIHNTKYTPQVSAQSTMNLIERVKERSLDCEFHPFGLSPDLIQARGNHEDCERLLHSCHVASMSPWLWRDRQSPCMTCRF